MISEAIVGSDSGLLLRSFLKIATILATFKTYQTYVTFVKRLKIWFNALARASSAYLKNMPERLSILAALEVKIEYTDLQSQFRSASYTVFISRRNDFE